MRTLLAYLALMLSSMAWWLCLPKSSGAIWTRSAIFVCEKRSDGGINLGEFNRTTHEDEHFGCWISGPVGSCHGRVKTGWSWERKVDRVLGMSGTA